jgi:transposase-like protein
MEEWNQKIKQEATTKAEQVREYKQKKERIVPQLVEAHASGISTRKLEEITGINHTTIARWIKEAKKGDGKNA